MGENQSVLRWALLASLVAASIGESLRADPPATNPSSTTSAAPREISADFNRVKGDRNLFYRMCVGSDHCDVLLRPANQQQLAVCKNELGFQYVRCHGTLDDDMGIYKEVNGKPVYSFEKLDQLYSQLLSLGMRPFIELSFMPNDLARGKKTIFYYRANVTQPKDYQRWSDLISAMASHLEERFGAVEVRQWYFEVWNEPNYPAFWDSSNLKDYEHMYDVSAAAIKKVDPLLRVGGPATAGCGWVKEFIAHCHDTGTPLDFVSTHTYAVKQFFDPDGKADNLLSDDPDSIAADVLRVRKWIADSPIPNLPLHFTEWSASSSPRDPVHDAYLSASFILDKVKKCEGATQSMSYWTYSDLFEENGPPPSPFHGGFGLLTREGIRKASFFAYKYLNDLGGQELADTDRSSWVCRQGGDVSALFWDHTLPNQKTGDVKFFRQLQPPTPLPDVWLHLTGIKPGNYLLEVHRTGFESNDAYSAYIAMGFPKNLAPEQLADLQQASDDSPVISQQVRIGEDGIFDRQFPMRTNDVILVLLKGG